MSYTFSTENFEATYLEIEPLYREHYGEMCARLEADGQACSPYNPRLDEYVRACRAGYLHTFILRFDGKAVGYINVYTTNDMHNRDFIAREDTVFVTKSHRNGIGKKFIEYGLSQLNRLGVKRLSVSAMTDLRVEKLWARMGFKKVAVQMVYQF
jgi:predicted acetyltransferase